MASATMIVFAASHRSIEWESTRALTAGRPFGEDGIPRHASRICEPQFGRFKSNNYCADDLPNMMEMHGINLHFFSAIALFRSFD